MKPKNFQTKSLKFLTISPGGSSGGYGGGGRGGGGGGSGGKIMKKLKIFSSF